MPYDPLPGPRIPYDIDGTAVMMATSQSGIQIIHPDAVGGMNSILGWGAAMPALWRAGPSAAPGPGDYSNRTYFGFIFPQKMRLDGVAALMAVGSYGSNIGIVRAGWMLYVSENTTNGVDGDWTTYGELNERFYDLHADGGYPGPTVDAYYMDGSGTFRRGGSWGNLWRKYAGDGRGVLTPLAGSMFRNIKGVRLWVDARPDRFGNGFDGLPTMIHLYGSPDSEASSDRLALWAVGTDEPLSGTSLVWGDTPQGSSADKTFRVKNLSASLTAASVVVAARPEAGIGLFPDRAGVEGYLLFSLDQSTWTPSVEFSLLTPGAVSPTIYVRRTVPNDALLGLMGPRVAVEAGSWS